MSVAALLALGAASAPAMANCVTVGTAITCSTTGGTQTGTVGSGRTTPAGTTLDVQSGAQISTTDVSGASLADNANIVVRSGGAIRNTAIEGTDSPYGGGIGANAVEFNNNSTIVIEQGGSVIADGPAHDSEAMNPQGGGNTIINQGLVRSTNTAIYFQSTTGNNTVVNNGTMEAGYAAGIGNPGTASVLGANGTVAIDFTNRGSVIGSLNFAAGNDVLRVYTGSSISGDINGGGGSNVLTLNSDNAAADTFTPRSLANFQTLQNNGGTWTFTPSLAGSGITGTTVNGGTLILAADASGYTGSTTVATAGTLQSTGAFAPRTITNAGLVRFAQPVNASYTGLISGTGGIEKTGAGTLTLTQNQAFSGATTITAGTLQLGTGGTSGSVAGDVVDNGALVVNRSDAVTLPGSISGTGSLSQIGTGTTLLVGRNTYLGTTTVASGTLRAGNKSTFSPASAHVVAAGATLDLAGHSQGVASLSNSGVVSLVGSAPGTTLTVTGPYVGNNGVLRLGTALGNSSSISDRLILSGSTAIATGNTSVAITNLGGLGALTTGNGIEVVSAVNGATTSKTAFSLAGGHVDAGAYEYRLYAADANGSGDNWYLRSTGPGPAAPVPLPVYRAEVPLFAALPAQLRQMDLAMLGNLHQRIGDDDVRGPGAPGGAGTSAASADRRAWGRVIATDIDIQQHGTVSPSSDGHASGFQVGTDLWTTSNWRAGIYVGQLDGDARVSGLASGVANLTVGRNDLRSQYFGAYGTWTGNDGLYADGVLQAGRHRVDVDSFTTPRSSDKGKSLLASIEVGKAFPLSENWLIEPQLQLVHQRLSLDDAVISGAYVVQDPHDGWLGRAGVRVKGRMNIAAGLLQPYARLNFYRASSGTDVARFIGPAGATDIATPVGYRSTELAGGATLALNARTSLYGEVGKLWSSGGQASVKSSLQGSLGVRVTW